MLYSEDLGPALKRLRVAKGLTQEAVAVRFGRQVQTISRLEQPGSNVKAATLVRYLNALDASFEDLHRALNDPLAREIKEDDARLGTDAPYRELVRGMLAELGGPNPLPAMQAVVERIDVLERRLDRVEASGNAEPLANHGNTG